MTYVVLDIGCRECSFGTSVLGVTDDEAVARSMWEARTGIVGATWGQRDDLDSVEDGWPDNVISCAAGSDYAIVAYAIEAA